MTTPEPVIPPTPEPGPHPPVTGPSVLNSLLLLLLPALACVTLGLLNKAVFGNKEVLVVPIVIVALAAPLIVGITAAYQISRRMRLNVAIGILMALGFIVASFALCVPGCAVLL